MKGTEKKIRATDGVSRKDLLGTLRAYEALFDSLGFDVRLELDEFAIEAGLYICVVSARHGDDRYGAQLWTAEAKTARGAREYVLRQAHSESGMPPAFSEEEAKMRIALSGADAFRPACRKIDTFRGTL